MSLNFLTVDQWLHYFETRPQQEIQLGLDRIKAVAEHLQVLDINAVVITVAGTNGKGSTVATLEAIYSEAGYQVGTYTSPHLVYFNERIRLNQQNIEDLTLCEAFKIIEEARGDNHLTYFEMATLAALLHFKHTQPDVIILEVGLGGRLDATNIVDADLAIITTVDFDHEAYLGDTIEAIGFEKAGILKPNQQFIYADANIPNSVKHRAEQLGVASMILNQDYSFELNQDNLTVILSDERVVCPRPKIHPKAATSGVIASRYLASRLPIKSEHLNQAIKIVQLPGRQQFICDTISTILDVAHNPQAVNLLAERIKAFAENKCQGKIHAVFSGLKDKNLCGLIRPMNSLIDDWYTAVLDNPRAASAPLLNTSFYDAAGVTPHFYESIVEAYQAAKERAVPGDWIVVYGSFFVVSPVILAEGWVCSG